MNIYISITNIAKKLNQVQIIPTNLFMKERSKIKHHCSNVHRKYANVTVKLRIRYKAIGLQNNFVPKGFVVVSFHRIVDKVS